MKHTPLYDIHLELNGKIVDFGGWALPVEYEGILAEYDAVRNHAGLFDVSHMGEYTLKGPGSEAFLQMVTTNDIMKIGDGRIQYSPVCYPHGGTVDDIISYRINRENYFLVVNAANSEKDGKWFRDNLFGEVELEDCSHKFAQLALQGPKSQEILQKITDSDLSELKFFRFSQSIKVAGLGLLISRSGYTGEDGFELYLAPEDAPKLWKAICEAGKDDGLKPAGLGARDLLRFEASLPLYGQEISETVSPLTAGLDRFIKFDKPDFIGKEALLKEKSSGSPKTMIAFAMEDRAVPRGHYPIMNANGDVIGEVTHGTFSPAMQKSVGLGYVEPGEFAPGDKIAVLIRNKSWPAVIVEKPFYQKKSGK